MINRLCWNEERQAYVDTVRDEWAYRQYQELCRAKGWQILPGEKYHGCLRVSEQTNTLAALCDCVPPDGIVGIGSPFFLFFTLGALFHIGEGRLAFDVMRREWTLSECSVGW